MGFLGSLDGLHVALELLVRLLGSIALRLVSLAEQELALAVRRLVEFYESAENGEPDSRQPALACSSRHCFEIEVRQELNFDEHSQVVEEPIEGEGDSCQNLKVLLSGGQLPCLNHRDLYILVEKLEEAEEFTGDTHIIYHSRKETLVRNQVTIVREASLIFNYHGTYPRGLQRHLRRPRSPLPRT